MPIYEYHCQKCGPFEVTQRITEKALSRCPSCKGKVKKLISNTSFQLKGTGWYITDYARKEKGEAKTGNGAKAASEPKQSKSESKAESSAGKNESSSASSTAGGTS